MSASKGGVIRRVQFKSASLAGHGIEGLLTLVTWIVDCPLLASCSMKPFAFAVCLLILLTISSTLIADDAAAAEESSTVSTAAGDVPTLVEITPAGVDLVMGFNRLGEAFDRAFALNKALGLSFPTDDIRQQFEVGVGEGVVDFRGPLVVYAMSPFDYADRSIDRLGVAVVVNDPQSARVSLRVPEETLDAEIFTGKFGATRFPLPALFRDHALYATLRNEPMRELLEQGTLAGELDDDLRAELNAADFVALARRGRMLDEFWRDYLPAVDASLNAVIPDPEQQPIEEQFRQLIQSVESVAFAGNVIFDAETPAQISGGRFGLSMLCDHAEGSESAQLLAGLATDSTPTSLNGLPNGEVVVAFAGRFGSAEHLNFVRHVTDLAADMWNESRQLPDSLIAEQFLAVFEEGGEHLQGMRLGIYRNEELERHGSFSLLMIFDSENPQGFVEDMRQLIRLASADELAKVDEEVLTEDEIRALVTQLGDRAFRTRRSASNRLMLVGPPAIPFLREGLEADSLELRTRAQVILDQMEALDTYESRHFLGSELFQGLKLEQRYVIAGEQLGDGTPVDFITYAIADEAHQPFAQQLATWLGPDWGRWRLAATDSHVVVLVGSDTELLTQALENLNEQDGESLELNSWGESSRPHQFEMHFDGNAFMRRDLRTETVDSAAGTVGSDEGTELVSVGISVTRDAVHVDAFVPLSQMSASFWPFGF